MPVSPIPTFEGMGAILLPQGVGFRVWAPHAEKVSVVGSFNDWNTNDWRATTPWGDTRPDFGRGEVRTYIHHNALMWLRDFGIDGLRWDMTVFIRSYCGSADGGNDDLKEGWSLMQWLNESIHNERHAGTHALYRDLIALRRNCAGNTAGLSGLHIETHHVDHERKILGYHRWRDGGAGDDLVVVFNLPYQSVSDIASKSPPLAYGMSGSTVTAEPTGTTMPTSRQRPWKPGENCAMDAPSTSLWRSRPGRNSSFRRTALLNPSVMTAHS